MSFQAAMKREMAGAQVRIDQNAFTQLLLGHAGLRLTCFLGAHDLGARHPFHAVFGLSCFLPQRYSPFNSLPW